MDIRKKPIDIFSNSKKDSKTLLSKRYLILSNITIIKLYLRLNKLVSAAIYIRRIKIMKAYTLKEHKVTGEYHIFVGDFFKRDNEMKCDSLAKSDCKAMEKIDSKGNIFTCKDENEARILCAKHGRKVCANCIMELYKNI